MDYSIITNGRVRAAVEAWQKGNLRVFLSLFTSNPELLDDGHSRDFHKFVEEACGKERYLEIDNVTEEGYAIYGKFDAGRWGIFRAYFKFHEDDQGVFNKLEIGQVE